MIENACAALLEGELEAKVKGLLIFSCTPLPTLLPSLSLLLTLSGTTSWYSPPPRDLCLAPCRLTPHRLILLPGGMSFHSSEIPVAPESSTACTGSACPFFLRVHSLSLICQSSSPRTQNFSLPQRSKRSFEGEETVAQRGM